MDSNQRIWLWISAVVSLGAGIILVMNGSGAGWFLMIMGVSYLGASTRSGQALAASNPVLVRWGLVGATVLLVALAVVAAAFLLS